MPVVIGPPERANPGDTTVVSMLFHKDAWTPKEAAKWLKDNGFTKTKIEGPEFPEDEWLWARQAAPEGFVPGTLRTTVVDVDRRIKSEIGKLRTR